ncbi:MAG: sec-independent protein translocase protein TatB [Frankiaceae bacterium]|nr:sec-independent protein translocase protein TatB [Frankiaceae bacterium]MDX6224109.1 sec-independent protein translocase protein TatB [Frankiales bacterium]
MFNLGAGEAAVIGLVAVVVLGPDRLPRAAQEVGRVLRHLRGIAQDAKDELRAELGPEVDDFRALDIRSLDPRRMIREHMLGEDDAARPSRVQASGPPPWDPDAT